MKMNKTADRPAMTLDREDTLKIGWLRHAAVSLFVVLALSGCVSRVFEEQQQARDESIKDLDSVKETYIKKLAFDPELAIIRGKSGISFNGCPIDRFDGSYPTEAERKAIKRFANLQAEYFAESDKAFAKGLTSMRDLSMAQKIRTAEDNHETAAVMLYEKKLNWRQYGELCTKIDAGIMNEMIRDDQQFWNDFNRAEQQRRKEQQEERRHQETINATQGSRTTTTNCSSSGGSTFCTTR
jgi:hypothetical protein